MPTQDATSDTAWVICPGCGEVLYRKRLARELDVCHGCGHHHRVGARARVEQLLDDAGLEWVDVPERSADVLNFVDTLPYPARLSRARRATGLGEGVVVVTGTVAGNPLVAAVMDFGFMGGSLGSAIGEAVVRAADLALRRRVPLVLVCASGGARMQEGALALMQMAKTSQALAQLDEAGILTISVITDPTFGGVAASFATLCDVLVAEPRARLGFAGPRVIEQTIRQKLPPRFQTAEFLLERGLIDVIRPRRALPATLARLLAAGRPARPTPSGTGPGGAGAAAESVIRDPARLPSVDAWTAVRTARDLDRPTTLDHIAHVFDDFEELRGDRVSGDCPAIVGGPAVLNGCPVMVIGHQKGHSFGELRARNHGMATPQGYRKAVRLMRMAAKLSLPLITLIDTPGAYPGLEAEESGQAMAIAEAIRCMGGLPTPIVSCVIGEGGSGGALAIGVADEVLMCSNATYSVISPEGCASILWQDRAMAPVAAEALHLTAPQLLRLGIADGVILEPEGGAQRDRALMAERLRAALTDSLRNLSLIEPDELRKTRRARFRSFGETADIGEAAFT
ncbi:acetyl-CoA carboxylase carboxyl transferase subunit alpha [Microbispora rosea]|uniref:acetyl-CoA carboxylase carboxyl transferase subunit alpha n=1 Tax=Microbispora rosea TaxID=58117 RepID=UPI003697F532